MKQSSQIVHYLKYGFYIKTVKRWQILFLLSLMTLEILSGYYRINENRNSPIEGIVFVILWWIPLISGFANLFRNIYISITWLILCVMWFLIHPDFITSMLPFIVFVFVHIARLVFKTVLKREPIFIMVDKIIYHSWDAVENRESNNRDFIFSLITMIIGAFGSIIIANI